MMKGTVLLSILLLLWDTTEEVVCFSTRSSFGVGVVNNAQRRRSAATAATAAGAGIGIRRFAAVAVRGEQDTTTATEEDDSTPSCSSSLSSSSYVLNDLGIDIPDGLRESLIYNAEIFHKHIWIVDNSGSMNMCDGHLLKIDNRDNSDDDSTMATTTSTGDCTTRWAEVQETVMCHALLAAALEVPTDFRLLNAPKSGGPQTFRVGYGSNADNSSGRRRLLPSFTNPFGRRHPTEQMAAALARTKPEGMTPLPACIREVRREIVSLLPQLQADGTRVSLIIATDGCNYNPGNIGPENPMNEEERNQELVEALASLQDLPVSVVIRLATDYRPVVEFYNSLDERYDWNLSIDVLDDHKAEAEEVFEHNPWLNYCLLLHRIREMGHYHPLLDLLDERPLKPEEIRDFCRLLYGKQHFAATRELVAEEEQGVDQMEWATEFLEEVSRIQLAEKRRHLNPRTNKLEPWINIEELAYTFLD